MTRKLLIAAMALTALLAFTGSSAFASANAQTPTSTTTISTAKAGKHGTVLVAEGFTVYALKAGKTACDATCEKTYVPVLLAPGSNSASAGNGVAEAKLGTKAHGEGTQITYGGKALYWSTKDTEAGQVHNASNKFGKFAAVVTKKASGGGSDAGTGGTQF